MRSWCLRRSRRADGERGVAIIEFSVVSGLMVLLLLGIMAYGEILANYVQLKYVVGELSRQVATGTSTADRQSRYTAAKAQILNTSSLNADCVSILDPSFVPGTIRLEATYNLNGTGCRLMPSFFLPMPTQLVATNEFTVQ
ncbi:TadE/TadG family type IV pilus assembly protein [Zavarzinia sp.]|uniref:TadE/TadG family type IV pilus assembly protein n=1 Tax=Zavarzinia sp. TaxID=2027920 RepID=UPI0035686246